MPLAIAHNCTLNGFVTALVGIAPGRTLHMSPAASGTVRVIPRRHSGNGIACGLGITRVRVLETHPSTRSLLHAVMDSHATLTGTKARSGARFALPSPKPQIVPSRSRGVTEGKFRCRRLDEEGAQGEFSAPAGSVFCSVCAPAAGSVRRCKFKLPMR